MLSGENCNHVFFDARVTIIPHDNDRDYTEEDARRHCGRNYLDAVREALPGCDLERIKQGMCPGWLITGGPVFENGGSGKCKHSGENNSCGCCWRIECPDDVGKEAQDHDD